MLERRKAYIEFHSTNSCTITTTFRQKSFNLKPYDVVDLITLKKVKSSFDAYVNPPCAFYAFFGEVSDGRKYLMAEVYAVTDPSGRPNSWGCSDIYDENKKVFEGTIWKP